MPHPTLARLFSLTGLPGPAARGYCRPFGPEEFFLCVRFHALTGVAIDGGPSGLCVVFSKLNPRPHFHLLCLPVQMLGRKEILNSNPQRFETGNLL